MNRSSNQQQGRAAGQGRAGQQGRAAGKGSRKGQQTAAANLDEVVITASDNDVWAVLSKANGIHIICVTLDPHVGLQNRTSLN